MLPQKPLLHGDAISLVNLKDFNNLSIIKEVNALDFGLSVLHARIRFLKSVIYYKLPVKNGS